MASETETIKKIAAHAERVAEYLEENNLRNDEVAAQMFGACLVLIKRGNKRALADIFFAAADRAVADAENFIDAQNMLSAIGANCGDYD